MDNSLHAIKAKWEKEIDYYLIMAVIGIGFCILIISGCTQQFSNAEEVNRRLSERRNYDPAYSYENAEMDGHGKESLDYGPRIDLVKAIWGD